VDLKVRKTPNKTPLLESGTERYEYSRLISVCLTHLLSDAIILIVINVMTTLITLANVIEIRRQSLSIIICILETYCLMPRLSRHVPLNPEGILSNTDTPPRRDKQIPHLT
jgi:hypothetical protein